MLPTFAFMFRSGHRFTRIDTDKRATNQDTSADVRTRVKVSRSSIIGSIVNKVCAAWLRESSKW